jgi:hypothetical protein
MLVMCELSAKEEEAVKKPEGKFLLRYIVWRLDESFF